MAFDRLLFFFILLFAALTSCGKDPDVGSSDQVESNPPPPMTHYSNPVCHMSLPDPTLIKVDDVFYLYATEDTRNTPIMCSTNLVTWKQCGTVFNDATRPKFVPGGGIWAPDINKIGNVYVLYYSMSVWGGVWTCGIGTAVAESPLGPWSDRGKMFDSTEIGVCCSIDPFYIEEDGRKYLFWGSFNGIWAIELSDNGLAIRSGAEKVQVSGTIYEGTYIHKRDGWYYLFASINSCCEGFNTKYMTVVGRSNNLFGPYLDKKGNSMMQNNHEVVIKGDQINFFGPGHNSEIVTDNNGDDWILYHSYTQQTGERARALMLDKVEWVDGWPVVNSGYPSKKAERPVF